VGRARNGYRTLAKVLGHANLRSVMRYIHISQEHMDQAILTYGEPQSKASMQTEEQEDSHLPRSGLVQ
jgi:hypothetical protein